MRTPSSRAGFTLIEILASMGAFILVFLTGSAGLMRLMQTQTINQQRTVAASAALLLTDWHATKSPLSENQFLNDITGAPTPIATMVGVPSWPGSSNTPNSIKWKGLRLDLIAPSGLLLYFMPTATSPTGEVLDLTAYKDILFSVSDQKTDWSSGMTFHAVSFWQGDPASTLPTSVDTFYYLGTYIIPNQSVP